MLKRILPLLLAAATLFAPRAYADDAAVADARHTLAEGVSKSDVATLQRARAQFSRLLAEAPDSRVLSYHVALCDWRIVPLLPDSASARAKKLCVEGIAACDRVLAADARHADALALKAALQGLSLRFFPNLTMSVGPEMMASYGRAQGMAPENPRVAFLAALSTMYTPAQYGGGAEKAKPQFEKTLALFTKNASDSSGIAWGHTDALLWSGRCLAQLGDWKGAADRYEQVLARDPDNVWVKQQLLPEAKQKLAAPAEAR